MREVVLFPDTFTNFFEPQVAIAAVEVLERAGFRVIIPRYQLCCGRPLYDQGMLDLAKARLSDVMDALRSIRRRRCSDRRTGAELHTDISRRVALALPGRSPREDDCVGRVPARRVPGS